MITGWAEDKNLDPAATGELFTNRIVVDGRNALDLDAWRDAGWDYRGIAKPGLVESLGATRNMAA